MSSPTTRFVDLQGLPRVSGSAAASRLYIPQLDVMRFYAFLSVFFFHALPSNDVGVHTGLARTLALIEATIHHSGDSGVALFFLLSAYLITELLRREKAISGHIHLKMFYIRRTLRIWPLYFLVVCVGLALSASSAKYKLSRMDLLTYAFFLKNWDIVFRGWNWNPIYILWTVSAEEQFYLVWPLAQKMFSRKVLLMLSAFAMIVIPVGVFWPSGLPVRQHTTEILFLFIYFPLGGILSFALSGRRWVSGVVQCLALLTIGVALWLLGSFMIYPDGDHEGTIASMLIGRFIIVAGTVSTFLAFLWSDPRWSPTPLIYLGKISYGLYVYHLMMLQLVAVTLTSFGAAFGGKALHGVTLLVASFVLTTTAATLSYEFFEKPFLRLKDKFTVAYSRAA